MSQLAFTQARSSHYQTQQLYPQLSTSQPIESITLSIPTPFQPQPFPFPHSVQVDDHAFEILESTPPPQLNEKQIRELISTHAKVLNAQFEYNGTVTLKEMNEVIDLILDRSSEDGTLALPGLSPKYLLLCETFGLSKETASPFEQLRKNILRETELKSEAPSPSFVSRLGKLFGKQQASTNQEIADLKARKLETIEWAKKEWDSQFVPSAPPLDDDMKFVISAENPSLTNITPQVTHAAPTLQERVVPIAPQSVVYNITPQTLVYNVMPQTVVYNVMPQTLVYNVTPQQAIAPIVSEPREGIPLVSYVDVAYRYLFNTLQDDRAVWGALPKAVQRDVIRHSYHFPNCQGRLEDFVAQRFFNNCNVTLRNAFTTFDTPIGTTDWGREGERLIELYYSEKGIKHPLNVAHQFQAFTPTGLFLDCIREAAGTVGVDRQYAVENWNQVPMIALAVQSLERCLHTGLRY